ncbi:ATP-grasp domain-containing protein [Enterobacter quasiroggenkampii]|uniref:ATP-grasp domain-containing protein n=1 Tax=Enterobacter quasiroggenkampii TaxID=2497436 RepID=UPI0021CE3289|nr:ATP-grasp domain-containing protein [Enterobacter quasiroggenkampii]MCU6406667.1 hypothetical protein [Enterobacter quasiroggenkampii]
MTAVNILIIAEKSDQTAIYFSDFLSSRNIDHKVLSWSSIFKNMYLACKTIKSVECHFSGIYVREPSLVDIRQCSIIEAIYCTICNHKNVIKPSSFSTNWAKHLHDLELNKVLANHNDSNFYTPDTFSGFNIPVYFKLEIIKPVSSMRGHTEQRVYNSNYLFEPYNSTPTPFLLQKEISGKEIRAHVIDGNVTAVIVHHATHDYKFKENGRFYCENFFIDERMKKVLLDLATFERSRFCGIDIIIDDRGSAWVLEVNPMPGFHTFDSARHDSLHPISDLLYKTLSKPS